MIRLLLLLVALLILWQFFRIAIKKDTEKAGLEEARTIGLQEAQKHIQSPILLSDYAEARGIPVERLESMVVQSKIPSYQWQQYTYIENRELINVNK